MPEDGSAQEDLWGFNLWVEEKGEDFIEFDSLINIRSWQGNPSRDLKALEAGKESRAISAFARFQELIDLTIRYGRQGEDLSARSAMWEELCRFRELYCVAFEERNLPELAAANRYLDQFASIR